MSSAVFDESNTVLSYINTIVTLLGVIWALWTAAWHLNLTHATKHLGSICQDKNVMGWFVAQLPGWWTRIFPFGMRRVPFPRVPGISTLIKAGDSGVFTSSLFDSIHHSRKQVSWIPIYEAFFIEAAWNCLEQWSLDQETQNQDPLNQRGDVARFLEPLAGFYSKLFGFFARRPRPPAVSGSPPKQNASVRRRAAERVWRGIRFAEGKETNWFQYYLHRYYGLLSTAKPKEFSVARSRLPLIDRHLLYYPWNIWDDETWRRTKRVNWADLEKRTYLEERPHLPPCKRPVKFGPILVKAHILLPDPEKVNIDADLSSKSNADLKSTTAAIVRGIASHAGDSEGTPSENSPQNQQWIGDFQNLWIHDNMPCIEVSEDELGALALVMGIPLHCSERESPCGPSAFSPCLSSTTDGGCLKRLKFTYGRCRSTSPNAGSGYSILFAKYLGCSCLPFAREYVKSVSFKETEKMYEVLHAVHVTWEVLSLIKQGNPIWTNPRGPDFTTASSKYLARLPTSATPYLYDFGNVNREQVSTEDKAGCIYKKFKNDNNPPQLVGSWTKAVARIAFGGLVPMAAKPLIDAVKFTVGREFKQEDLDTLELLVDLVMQSTNNEIGSKDFSTLLFGFERQKYSDMAAGRDKMDINISLKNGGRIMEIVHVLVRYNTLLERLMAMMAAPDEENRQTQVYSILCRSISERYKSACKKEKGVQDKGTGLAENGTQPTNTDNALKRVKNTPAECKHKWQPTPDDCAVAARYIIKAWTCIAKIVDWREAGDPEDKSQQEQEGTCTSQYRLQTFQM